MRIVLDTNVLVSGLLTPFGVCGEVVRMLMSESVVLCVDSRILLEYEEVLKRPRFKIRHEPVDILMEYIDSTSEMYCPEPLSTSLPDQGDNPFLEVALSAHAHCLVTGNLKHFPRNLRQGVHVLSPREFFDLVADRE